MSKFDPQFGRAEMGWSDNEGYYHTLRFVSNEKDPSELSLLKGCINMAVEEMQKTEKNHP
jgi:hypothetical protein